jgi:hypothetical protein
MPNLTSVLEAYLKDTKQALAVAVVDMRSGLLIGVAHNIPYFTETYLEAVSAAAVDMFRGKTVSTVEKMLTGMRGALVRDMIKEAQIITDATCHFMVTSRSKPDVLGILITTRAADMMAGWAAARSMLSAAAPYCP